MPTQAGLSPAARPFTPLPAYKAVLAGFSEGSVSWFRFALVLLRISRPLFYSFQVVELKFGGKDIPVTSANRIAYIHLVADYRLNRQIRQHCLAFRQGLANVVNLEWLRMFDQQEIQVGRPCPPGPPLPRNSEEPPGRLPHILRIELVFQVLISGAQVPISLDDLKSFTNYSGKLPLLLAYS